jgi:hypothetical protein
MVPIRCEDDQCALAMSVFPCQAVQFLVKYLGIPLSVTRLPRSALVPLVDRMADKLPVWKGRLMHRSGRLVLIKSTLTVIPIRTSISANLIVWMRQAMENIMKVFYGQERTPSSKASASWPRAVSSDRSSSVGWGSWTWNDWA